MPWIHLCRSTDCWCEGRLYGEIVLKVGHEPLPQPDWHSDAMEAMHMAMKKPTQSAQLKPMPNAWTDPGDKVDYPNIYSFMTDLKYDDGSPRVPGAISIFTQLGVLKACINDKDNKRTAFVEALNIMELIAMVELSICDDKTEWRASQPSRQIPY